MEPKINSKFIMFVGGDDIRMRIPFLSALKKAGYQVAAIGSEDESIFVKNDIPYFRYSLNRWIAPWADIRSYLQLLKLFKQHKPDIIHAFDTKPALIAPIAARQAGVPLRFRTITGMGYVFSSGSIIAKILKPIYRASQRLTSASSAVTIFQNTDDLNYFQSNRMVEDKKATIVKGSGIDIIAYDNKLASLGKNTDLKQSLGLSREKVVLMVARLVKDKGVVEFLEASRRILQFRNDIDFVLVGPLASEGKQAISKEIIEKYSEEVHYLGERRDIPELLNLSDCFVLPSFYREGVPRVLLEAGWQGVPIVTTDMPGCREIVKDGWNGWLVPPREIPALAGAIVKTIDMDVDEQSKFGQRSRQYIREEFSLECVFSAYTGIYVNNSHAVDS
jgi:glycosyltransferase involved in cell wall biosynthesis